MPLVKPCVEHRHCVRHLHNNFKSDRFSGQALKDRLWNLARASYVGKFKNEMAELQRDDKWAFRWFANKDPAHWSRLHFSESPKCDILLNNLCESFNAVILSARGEPIFTMLERIRTYLMDRLFKRREYAKKWHNDLGPKIHKILEKNKINSFGYIPALARDRKFEAWGMHGDQFIIDLDLRTHSCRRWDLIGIPCQHAVAVIWASMEELENYVDNWYSKETFLKVHCHIIYPMNGADMWEKTGKPPIEPPQYSRPPGRPKKDRNREPDEAPKTNHKLKKFQKAL